MLTIFTLYIHINIVMTVYSARLLYYKQNYSIMAGAIDTLPSGQCVSLLFELISMTHQLEIDYYTL